MNRPVVIVGDVIDDIVVTPLSDVVHDTDNHSRIRYVAGGSGANQAAWLAHLGVPVRFVGRVGARDVDRHRGALEALGVSVFLAGDDEVPTGTIVVLVDPGGGRTMYTDRGANLRLSASDIPDGVLDGAAWLQVNGYPLFADGPRAALLDLIAEARSRGIPFSVDPCSATFLTEAGVSAFLAWTRGATICFPNSDEGLVLTGRADPFEAAAALAEIYPVVALTIGADGVVVCTADFGPTLLPTDAHVAGDATGAGDAFCAGFLAAWLAGESPMEAAQAGLASAAQAVTVVGARPLQVPR